MTRDLDFADIRRYPPATFHGIIVLRLADDVTAEGVARVIERFLQKGELVMHIPRHLVILEHDQVRFRPPLQGLSGDLV